MLSSSSAAELEAVLSWNSACSALRLLPAVATEESRAWTPDCSAAMSSDSLAMAPFFSVTLAASVFILDSRDLDLAATPRNSFSQYSFLDLSSAPSCFISATMPSIFSRILVKSAFFPASARAKKFSSGRLEALAAALSSAAACFAFCWLDSCRKAGLRLLKRSSELSDISILMVSCSASCSSARAALRCSPSLAFSAQLFWSSASIFLSSSTEVPCSDISRFRFTTSTFNSPMVFILRSNMLSSDEISVVLAVSTS
mmetsp:Transcript_98801/g.235507  ORF Transcript_98801/g.235507 Transcript_98801/m.235507 type:complete len:257 (+) Transcript_98801:561-1331(+)